MPRNVYLMQEEKIKIDEMRNEGKPVAFISEQLNRSRNVIYRYIKSPSAYGKSIQNTGRPRKFNDKTKRRIRRMASNKDVSLREIKKIISVDISHESIRGILNASSIKYSTMLRCPPLTKVHKLKRVEFAESMLRKGEDYHRKIVFSDEKRFCLNGPDGKHHYWHDLRKEKIIFHAKQYDKSVMVWAAISSFGIKSITFVDGNITSEKYISVLEDNLIPNFEDHDYVFQQDNCSSHSAKRTKEWLENENVNVLNWPSISPDINIIENVWGIISRRIYNESRSYTSFQELKNMILKVWNELGDDTINNLYSSFTTRCIEIIRRKGGFLV